MKDITVAQFETIVTQRVLYACMSSSAVRNGFDKHDMISKASFIGSETLYDYGFKGTCRCRLCGAKIFLIHEQNKRIIAELGLAADPAGNRLCRRPRFYLLSRRGFIKQQKLANLISEVGKLNNYVKNRR